VIPTDGLPAEGDTARPPLAILCRGIDRTGVLHEMTSVIVRHGGYIHSVDILERGERSAIYWELFGVDDEDSLIGDLESLDIVTAVERVPSMLEVFGKRIIVIGGGAQVGQVALGAIAEADRHNIRGEKISVDTIPIVGEENLANAVRAVQRLPRAVALVLAGSLMGGEITRAVQEVRKKGVLVFSLNMAGSAPASADLVISDPVQAGVMAVMAVARTASFDISRQRGRVY
jgi:energy-converting hydrogenase B subunit Q